MKGRSALIRPPDTTDKLGQAFSRQGEKGINGSLGVFLPVRQQRQTFAVSPDSILRLELLQRGFGGELLGRPARSRGAVGYQRWL